MLHQCNDNNVLVNKVILSIGRGIALQDSKCSSSEEKGFIVLITHVFAWRGELNIGEIKDNYIPEFGKILFSWEMYRQVYNISNVLISEGFSAEN